MKNPRLSRRKEILRNRAEINAKEAKDTIAKINKTKSWFFEKLNKVDEPLAILIKKQWEKNEINKIRNENGEITIENREIQRIICDYYQHLNANKIDKPLARLIKKQREKNQINKIRNENGEITTDNTEMQTTTISNYMPIKWTTWKK